MSVDDTLLCSFQVCPLGTMMEWYWWQILKPAEKKAPKYGYGAAGGRRESGIRWRIICTDRQRLLPHQGRTRRARHKWSEEWMECRMKRCQHDRSPNLVFTCLYVLYLFLSFPYPSLSYIYLFSSSSTKNYDLWLSKHVWVSLLVIVIVIRPKVWLNPL